MNITLFRNCSVSTWTIQRNYTYRIRAFTWCAYYGTTRSFYVSFTWIKYMCTTFIGNYYVSFIYNWWKKCAVYKWIKYWVFGMCMYSFSVCRVLVLSKRSWNILYFGESFVRRLCRQFPLVDDCLVPDHTSILWFTLWKCEEHRRFSVRRDSVLTQQVVPLIKMKNEKPAQKRDAWFKVLLYAFNTRRRFGVETK